ncbi:acyl-CoA dehydrogenase family protein [Saxibacter everestensis]|uniref:Acyl-CoA dehydrogenase family protein n=1 Tax=Saxibacter everestensis TaxID=2909229 RepID=A0ABY8QTT8_9MICO|nr:acyl-CoA dehydrogenase family protein [Brevibacteriaceae bacterium ZFBP1038]
MSKHLQAPEPSQQPKHPASPADFTAACAGLAAVLAADVESRELAGLAPHAEVELFRDAGILPALIPAERGGIGLGWRELLTAIRPILRVDASVGHALAYHYVNSWRINLNRNADSIAALEQETAARQLFWGGAGNPRDAGLTLMPDGRNFLVSGRKFFATGAEVADRITASGTRADTGEKLAIVIDGRGSGVSHPGDWDNIGQRLSASGSVIFDNAIVAPECVLGSNEQTGDPQSPRGSLSILLFQAVLCHLHVAIAEGALESAAEYTRTKTRPWATSGVDLATEDPYIRTTHGELVSQVRAADALTWRATERLIAAMETGWELSDDARGEAAIEIAAAKVSSTRAVLEATSKAFELTGARATARSAQFDRFWRNARTITLHDPVAYKAQEVGIYELTGVYPTPSAYS